MVCTNTCHETFTTEWIVNVHTTSVGGVLGVTTDRQWLTSCQTRARYTAHCEDTQRSRLSESESKKRKCAIDEIEVKDDWISGAWNVTCTEKCFAKARFIGLDRFELQDPDSTETSDLESLITEVTASLGCDGTPSVDSSIHIYGDDMIDSVLVMMMTRRMNLSECA